METASLPAIPAKRALPDIKSLYADVDMMVKHNELAILLNQPPKDEWLKDHPTARNKDGGPIKYIPIERTEWLLSLIFIKWKVEVIESKVMINSISVTVRLHYIDPITGQWDWSDGVGAAPVRTNQGAAATDFSQVQSSAVQTALPAAESYAVKDAAEKLGKLFGKDLNRAGEFDYSKFQSKFDNNEPLNK